MFVDKNQNKLIVIYTRVILK